MGSFLQKTLDFLNGNCLESLFGSNYNDIVGWLGFIFGTADFIVYVLSTILLFGVLKSISITYYSVKPRWLFQAFMYCALFCIMLMGQNNLYYIVGLLFLIMTLNPSVGEDKVKEKKEMRDYYNRWFIPHVVCAISAITLAIFGLWICFGLWQIVFACAVMLLFLFYIAYKTQYFKERLCFFIEVYCILFLIGGLMLGRLFA